MTFTEWLKFIEHKPAIGIGYKFNTIGDMYRVELIRLSRLTYRSE